MKAAVLAGVRRVEIRDVPAPEIRRPDDVLVRPGATGICGSDLHYYEHDCVGGDPVVYPFIPGHECAGVVAAAGPAVAAVRPGDAVVVEPAVSCGTCDQCLAGRRNTCRRLSFMGHAGELTGGMAELVLVPERNVVRLPAGMDLVRGALAEPLSIALHALALGGPAKGRSAAVLGMGPIGLCVALALRAEGAGPVFVTERVPGRLEAAAAAAPEWAGNPDRADVVTEILARRPLGLDLVFECCGDPAALDQAVRLLQPGGTLVAVGIPIEARVSFPSSLVRRREIRVQNVRRQNACLERAVAMAADGRIDLSVLRTRSFPLERAAEAYEAAAARSGGILKCIVLAS